jgi:Short C-terminal domain
MFELVFLIVIVSSIWAGLDAHAKRIPIDNKPYSLNNGGLAWFGTCILLWIFGFPYYLYKRAKAAKTPNLFASAPVQDATEQIRKLSELAKEGIITQDEFERKKKQLLGI